MHEPRETAHVLGHMARRCVSAWIMWFSIACAACAPIASLGAPDPVLPTLPTLGTVGDVPRGPDTLTIRVLRNGALSCEGAPVDLEELERRLREKVAALPWTKVHWLEWSELRVLIEADRDLPIGALGVLLDILCRPELAVPQVFYSVRSEADAEIGALALFLPYDIGGSSRDPRHVPFVVQVGQEERGSDPAALQPRAEAFLREQRPQFDPVVECQADADVPVGFALRVVDALLRAGIGQVALNYPRGLRPQAGSELGSASLVSLVEAIGPVRRAPGIRWRDELLGEAATPLDAMPRVRGRFAGVTQPFRVMRLEPPPDPPAQRPIRQGVDSRPGGSEDR